MTLRTAALLAFVAACSDAPPDETTGTSQQAMFFENSTRRDATPAEAERVAHTIVDDVTNCTAFFLENSANKVYVASARHCFGKSIGNWCDAGGTIKDNAGTIGKCKEVVAADFDHDIAVVEVDIPHASTGPSTLRLAAYVPAVNDRLVMVGYPGDDDPQTARKGKLTTTENCWVLSGVKRSPYETDQGGARDMVVLHNCTTYGGNSGGPMYLEGTRHVVGLPFSYAKDDYTRRSPTNLETASDMALVGDYVFVHRAALRAAGISIAQPGETVPEPDAADAGAPPPESTPPTTRSADLPETPRKRLGAGIASDTGGCSTGRAAPPSDTLLFVAMLLLVRTRRARTCTSSPRS